MTKSVMATLGYQAKEKVTVGKCAACGKPVDIKVNTKGALYYFCPHVNDKREWCAHHQKWGIAHSNAIMLEAGKARLKSSTAPAPQPVEAPAKAGGFLFDE